MIYTSAHTATHSPQLSQRMARWISFFAEFNFEVKYNPGKQNALDNALSCKSSYELAYVMTLSSPVTDLILSTYAKDDHCVALLHFLVSDEFHDSDIQLSARLRASLHRYSIDQGLLDYCNDEVDPPLIVVFHDEDLKYRILYEVHNTAIDGHFGLETTNGLVCQSYWWPK